MSKGRTFLFALVLGVLGPAAAITGCSAAEEDGAEAPIAEEPERDPDAPGLHQLGPNRYEAVIYAFEGGFDPAEVRGPAGAELTIRTRSVDIPHGLYVQDYPALKLVVVMDEFRSVTHTFAEPGEHVFFCDEYCGGGHEAMRGRIVVE
jgi:cytochrome c oxidase subunit 2